MPRAAIEALLDARATAYEVCAYLTLACYTDWTGCYSSASVSAVNKATGANKVKGGPADRAIKRLRGIRAKRVTSVSAGQSGAPKANIQQVDDLGPIVYDRETWQEMIGEIMPDGPTERGLVRHVLPDFDEPMEDRIWFGKNLVTGIREFGQPLKALKNAGDVAARLLLSMYAANDMEVWGGVRPVGPSKGPWTCYEPVDSDVLLHDRARLIRAKFYGSVVAIDTRISAQDDVAYWEELVALEAAGLIYEVVMVLNKDAVVDKFKNGTEYSSIPPDAEPLYDLDIRSRHGFKPIGEEGLGGITARTAGELGYPVAQHDGSFDGTYAAIVPRGFPAMIAGIYRLRFRVANAKNSGVRGTWARIHTNNRDAYTLLQRFRAIRGLPELPAPWTREQPQSPPPPPAFIIPF